jgi:hypothetical protein
VAYPVTLPALFVAVRIYVVLEIGYTACTPVKATLPTPGLIETQSAPVTFHCRLEAWPATITVGDAVKLTIVGAIGTVTGLLAV